MNVIGVDEEGGVNEGIAGMDAEIQLNVASPMQKISHCPLNLRLLVLVVEAPPVVARPELPKQRRVRWGKSRLWNERRI